MPPAVSAPSPYITVASEVHPGDIVLYGGARYTVMPSTQRHLVRLRPHNHIRERGPQDVYVGLNATMQVGQRERPVVPARPMIPRIVVMPHREPPPVRKKYAKRVKAVVVAAATEPTEQALP